MGDIWAIDHRPERLVGRFKDDSSLPIIQGVWSASEVTISCTHILGQSIKLFLTGGSSQNNRTGASVFCSSFCSSFIIFSIYRSIHGMYPSFDLSVAGDVAPSCFALKSFPGIFWQLGFSGSTASHADLDDRKNWGFQF